jgi:hypothetical protein
LDYVNEGDKAFYNTPVQRDEIVYPPVLSDEIVAIGRPDAALAKALELPRAVALIGLNNTYVLTKGGEELERIAQLKLEGKRMEMGEFNNRLRLKDKRVRGELVLRYGGGEPISTAEVAELKKGGFTELGAKGPIYARTLGVEGAIYPALKLSDEQMSKLGTRHAFYLYNDPYDTNPPVLGKILLSPLIAMGAVVDIVLLPVYAVGVVVLNIWSPMIR